MIRLAIFLATLLLGSACAQTVVHTYSGTAINTSMAITITAPTAGNYMAVAFSCQYTDPGISSITGAGVTWSKAISSNTLTDAEVWDGYNSSGSGTTVTINFAASPNGYCQAGVMEVSGMPSTTSHDGTGTSNYSANPCNNMISGTVATSNAHDLLIAAAGSTVSGFSGPSNSFTALAMTGSTLGAYKIVSATGTYSTTWTLSSCYQYDAVILAIKASSGVTSTPSLSLLGAGR